MDLQSIREDFPILGNGLFNKNLVYLDNAATTQKPIDVIEATSAYYTQCNANAHRGVYNLSDRSTELYEKSRSVVENFISASSPSEIIFTKGATEAINLVASSLPAPRGRTENIVVTEMEHHSNFLPWQERCRRTGGELRILPMDSHGRLQDDSLKDVLDDNTTIVAISGLSNSTGYRPRLDDIVQTAHKMDIPVLVDAAQLIAHEKVDVQTRDFDFFAFSGHKLYGPMGTGILYGKTRYLEKLAPYQFGGDMVESVNTRQSQYRELPYRLEAGTQNICGIVGLAAAMDYLNLQEADVIHAHEMSLARHLSIRLEEIDGITVLLDGLDRGPIISFISDRMSPYDIASYLNLYGIAVRSGAHCAQPTMNRLGLNGTVRVSLAFYNSLEEVEYFIESLKKILERNR